MARIRIVTRLRDNRAKSSRILLGVSLLIFSTLVGVVGFMTLEDYQLLEAFYMTIITLSTVGFTEVKNLSDEGRLFTTVYIIFNLGIFAYSISIITTYIIEGEFRDIFHNYMISKQVRRMNQHIIVCGYGRNGRKACDELRRDKRPFVLIENNPDLLDDKLAGAKDFHYIIGDATVDDTLLAAGIERAEALITTLPRDADNVYITLTARELNPNVYIISRASEDNSAKKLHRAGADQVVMPDAVGGMHMAQLITKPEVIEFLNMLTGVSGEHLKLEDIHFDELRADYQSKSIRQLNIRQLTEATVIGYKSLEKGFIFNPSADLIIKKGDTMIILGNETSIEKFKQTYCKESSISL